MMGNPRILRGQFAGSIALCGALIAAGPVFGQSATDQTAATDQPASTADQGGGQLQEVVVTAERRAENLQSTPVSIVAVSSDQLQTAGVTDLSAIGQLAPNVFMYNSGTSTTADIRGVGNSNQGGVEEPGVVMVRDGLVNITEGIGEGIPFYDIADVEVLRGPQGTFSGDNSTAGAIYVNSANPNFGGVSGYVDGRVGTYTQQQADGAVNLPVSDTLAMRFAFNEETRNSFFYDIYTALNGPYQAGKEIGALANSKVPGENLIPGDFYGNTATKTMSDPGHVDDKDFRWGLLWKPTTSFQELIKIEVADSSTGGVPSQPNVNSFAPLAPGLPCPAGEGTAPACHGIYAPGYSGSPYTLNNWDSAALEYNDTVWMFGSQSQYTFAGGTQLRLTVGDQEINDLQQSSTSNDTLNVGSYSNNVNAAHDYSGEFDILSPTTGAFSWIAGVAENYDTQTELNYSVNVNTPYSVATPAYGFYCCGAQVYLKGEGVFAQVTWQFTHTLQLVVGGREGWDSEVNPTAIIATYRPNGLSPILIKTGIPPTDRVPTGKLDLNWSPVTGEFGYAFVARGYKPGESNIGTLGTVTHGARYEEVNDYELGWKSTFAAGHVETQVGGYYMQYFGMIEPIFNPAQAAATSENNIPYSNLKGIEVAMQAREGHLSLDLSGAYNKSILGPLKTAATYKFPAGYGITNQCLPGQTPNAGNTNCTDYTPFDVSLSGESLPYSPDYTGDATVQYSIPLGSSSLIPSVTYHYQGTSYGSIFQSDNYYLMPAYSLWGANITWLSGPWKVSAYGTNLANKLYEQSNSGSAVLYGNPRQVGFELNRSF